MLTGGGINYESITLALELVRKLDEGRCENGSCRA